MLSKTNMVTSFITKPLRNQFFKLNLDFVGFTFNKTSQIWNLKVLHCYNFAILRPNIAKSHFYKMLALLG